MRGGILVRHIGGEPVDRVTPGGIHMPQQSQPDHTTYEVVAVGPPMIVQGVGEVAPLVKVGDTVVAHRKPGRLIKLGGEPELVLTSEEAIWAVVDGETK